MSINLLKLGQAYRRWRGLDLQSGNLGTLDIEFKFVWYDLWIGAYFARRKHASNATLWTLYILPLPMCVIKISYDEYSYWN